jgi:hypothetical protein
MLSFPSEPTESQESGSTQSGGAEKPQPDWTSQIDTEQAFRLVDSILPFEACLYHQILPLGLEGSRLKLGMVNLDDSAALDYVRRILAYMNCSLMPQGLSSAVHYAALSAYLNYSGNQKKVTPSSGQPVARRIAKKLTEQSAKKSGDGPNSNGPNLNSPTPNNLTANIAPHHLTANTAANQTSGSNVAPDPPTQHYPVEKPPQNDFAQTGDQNHLAPNKNPQGKKIPRDLHNHPTLLVDSPPELEIAEVESQVESQGTIQDRVSPEIERMRSPQTDGDSPAPNPIPEIAPLSTTTLIDAPPLLNINPQHLSDPPEVLVTLAPHRLLQELLGRILTWGIGRLYLERQTNHGRILWSQSGVLQAVLEELPPPLFEGVISELKLLTHLPLLTVQKPKQVEIERLYQNQRLLLRLRLMPGKHGEEATLQVLRGAALRFYRQQQLVNFAQEALNLSQQLQQKVSEVYAHSRSNSVTLPDHLGIYPELDRVLKRIGHQVSELQSFRPEEGE